MSASHAKPWLGPAMIVLLAGCQRVASSPAPGLVAQTPADLGLGAKSRNLASPTGDTAGPAQPPGDPMLQPDSPTNIRRFSAKLEIDDKPGGKRFQGVWLVLEDGERWVIDYRAREVWKPFEGTTVEVTGEVYYPEGQAIGATHFRVERLTADPKSGAAWVELGPSRTLTGSFQRVSGTVGSKMEGESWPVFVVDDRTSYQLANTVDTEANPGAVEVVARAVTRAPTTAHMPGPTLWILNISSAKAE